MAELFEVNMASHKQLPKDAQVILSIMKELGINDHEPRVVNQLLEFIYRYITCILDDARLYANHARKKALDVDDIKLAIHLKMDRIFTNPPPRDILLEISRVKNSSPLPVIKPHCGIRLPPDRYCLSQCNYKLKLASAKKPIKPLASTFLNSSSSSKNAAMKTTPLSVLKRSTPMSAIKIQQVNNNQSAPKPVIKLMPGSEEKAGITETAPSMLLTSRADGGQGNFEEEKNIIKMETDEHIETIVVKQEDL